MSILSNRTDDGQRLRRIIGAGCLLTASVAVGAILMTATNSHRQEKTGQTAQSPITKTLFAQAHTSIPDPEHIQSASAISPFHCKHGKEEFHLTDKDPLTEHAKHIYELELDRAAWERFAQSAQPVLQITIPTLGHLRLESQRIIQRGSQTRSWTGTIAQAGDFADFTLVNHHDVIYGQIDLRGSQRSFEINTHHSGALILRELDADSYPNTDREMVLEAPPENVKHQQFSKAAQSDPSEVVDLVVGYSRASRTAEGGHAQMQARIIASVDNINTTLANSRTANWNCALLGTVEDPDYSESGSAGGMRDELYDLNNPNDGDLDAVTDLRTEVGADLAAFIVKSSTGGHAGIAFRGGWASVTARNYMGGNRLTFVHEIGHNMGLRHGWGDGGECSSTGSYNYGWRFRGNDNKKYRTVMAYNYGWTRVKHFSNPAVSYQGTPTGVADGTDIGGDERFDQAFHSSRCGPGFDGSNPRLGARCVDYLLIELPRTAARMRRTGQTNQSPVAHAGANQNARTGERVALDGSRSQDPDDDPLSYRWQQQQGPRVSIRNANRARAEFTPTEAGRYQFSLRVDDGELADTDSVIITVEAPAPSRSIGEAGRILDQNQTSSDSWNRLVYQQRYDNPITVFGPPSFNGGQAMNIRANNAQNNRIEYQLDEYDYLDGRHTQEDLAYLVMEAGQHVLADGTRVVAGQSTINHDWSSVNLPRNFFQGTPLILLQCASFNGSQNCMVRMNDASNRRFRMRLQEEEGNDGTHAQETVHWIAWEIGNSQGHVAAISADSVTHDNSSFSLNRSRTPAFLAQIQSFDGGDPAALRYTELNANRVRLFIEEEASRDAEINHTTERVGYLAIDPGLIRAMPQANN